jgi:hypothetical protein
VVGEREEGEEAVAEEERIPELAHHIVQTTIDMLTITRLITGTSIKRTKATTTTKRTKATTTLITHELPRRGTAVERNSTEM